VEWVDLGKGVKRKVMSHSELLMLVKVAFEAGAIGELHHHFHTQLSYVASGIFEMTIENEKKILREGDVYYVPPNQVHGAVCLEAGMLIDVFSPPREDFLLPKSK
jgi:quercetin dioxygenase-like cupin family protein